MSRRRIAKMAQGVLSLMVFFCLSLALPASAKEPLLMDGKKTIYQRVLTRPGAEIAAQPGASGGTEADAFSRYYVYERKTVAGKEWIEVGPDSKGKIDGWIQAEQSVPWKQQIALSITNPSGRSPLLFFKDRKTVEDIYGDFSPSSKFDEVRSSLEKNGFDQRVMTREPDTAVDMKKKFYLLPILDAEEIYSGAGQTVRILNVASVAKPPDSGASKGASAKAGQLKNFNAAIVFVIDSTISMGPYIDRTREAVREIYDTIDNEGLSDRVRFGLYAYRSSTKAVPELGYVSKLFADPSKTKDGDDFLAKVNALKPATVSSKLYDEDAYAGLMDAIQNVNWTEFGGRYIIHITDAGAIDSQSQYSDTKLGAKEVRLEAKHRGIALYTLHLKTPSGAKNHSSAEAQYEELTENDIVSKPLYYGVDAGDVEEFGEIVETLASTVAEQVDGAYRGKTVAGSARTADPDFGADEDASDQAKQAAEDAAKMGHAMMLAYLGSKNGEGAPDVLEAWIGDRDPKDMNRAMTEVHVLLTKSQLSDMQQILKKVLDAQNAGIIQSSQMFEQLRSAAVALGRDPSQINQSKSTKLIELGLFGEYLDGLPYKSDLLNMSEDEWSSMSANMQNSFLVSLNRKLRMYEYYNRDADRWVRLVKGGDASDDVYPVPLDALP